jgi:hypothetical protein
MPISFAVRGIVPVPTLQTETFAWVAQVVANGGSVSVPRQNLVDAFIISLKANGIWTKFDRLWLFAGENTASALTDLIARTLAVANGSPAFTVDQGYRGADGVTPGKWIDTGFNATSGTPNFTQNSAHHSIWAYNEAADNGGADGSGVCSGIAAGGASTIYPRHADGNAYFRCNDPLGGQSAGVANTTSLGLSLANRSGASAQQGYHNTTNLGVVAVTSVAVVNGNFYVLAANNVGTGAQYGNGVLTISAASYGGSFSSTDVTNFYNALRTYMTAIGAP